MAVNVFTLSALVAGASQAITTPREGMLLGVSVRYVTTATAGNRLLVLEVTDGADVIMASFVAGVVITASLTTLVHFGGSLQESAIASLGLRVAMGPTPVLDNWKIKCRDLNDIDSTPVADAILMAAVLQD